MTFSHLSALKLPPCQIVKLSTIRGGMQITPNFRPFHPKLTYLVSQTAFSPCKPFLSCHQQTRERERKSAEKTAGVLSMRFGRERKRSLRRRIEKKPLWFFRARALRPHVCVMLLLVCHATEKEREDPKGEREKAGSSPRSVRRNG